MSARQRVLVVLTTSATFCAALVAMSAWASPSRTARQPIRVGRGETVTLPAFGWTCLMSTASARPIFTCTRNRKPIVSATITAASIIVGSSHRPIRVHGGYRFPY